MRETAGIGHGRRAEETKAPVQIQVLTRVGGDDSADKQVAINVQPRYEAVDSTPTAEIAEGVEHSTP
jgi:hypothetical protein